MGIAPSYPSGLLPVHETMPDEELPEEAGPERPFDAGPTWNAFLANLTDLTDLPILAVRGLLLAVVSIGFVVYGARLGRRGMTIAGVIVIGGFLSMALAVGWVGIDGLLALALLGILAIMRVFRRELPR